MKQQINIVLTGVESSGKTSLAKALAKHYEIPLAEEFARKYLLQMKTNYVQEDLNAIAKGQLENMKERTEPVFICDTDLQVIKIWSLVKYKTVDQTILEGYKNSIASLYILCDPDFPWEFDELRENEFDRDKVHELYIRELETNKLNYIIAKGSLADRKKYCIECITKQFSSYI